MPKKTVPGSEILRAARTYGADADDPIVVSILTYCPRDAPSYWPQVQPWVITTMLTVLPWLPTADTAKTRVSQVAGYALFAYGEGRVVNDEILSDKRLILRWITSASIRTGRGLKTMRSNLAWVRDRLDPRFFVPAEFYDGNYAGPYPDEVIDAYEAAVALQPSEYSRDILDAALALTLGGGIALDGLDHLLGTDVDIVDGCVVVSVRGRNPRQAVIPPPWEERALRLAKAAGDGYVFAARHQYRSSGLGANALNRVKLDGLPRLSLWRLRCTWLVRVLNRTHVAILREATGTELTSLYRYMPFMDRPDAAAVRRFLRNGDR